MSPLGGRSPCDSARIVFCSACTCANSPPMDAGTQIDQVTRVLHVGSAGGQRAGSLHWTTRTAAASARHTVPAHLRRAATGTQMRARALLRETNAQSSSTFRFPSPSPAAATRGSSACCVPSAADRTNVGPLTGGRQQRSCAYVSMCPCVGAKHTASVRVCSFGG
jgi:hypothetical protein